MSDFLHNVILQSDSYKVSHHLQYPPGTENVYSYFESRGGEFNDVVFFGLQYYLKEYLSGVVVTQEKINFAEKIYTSHFGNKDLFYKEGWQYILEKHNGRLPVRIKALPEGTVLPVRNALITIEATDPNFYWLTNWLETMLVKLWAPISVASQSRVIKKITRSYLEKTGCETIEDQIGFKYHDFGYRGVSSEESAAILGASHLLNWYGTDTVIALPFIQHYYNTDQMPGFSIPASEHSTITSWGRDNEYGAFKNMLDKYPTGLVACVSDSYNIYEACWKGWGTELKEQVLARDGCLIVRPDSGNPSDVVSKIINILGEYFGYERNKAGYKVLDPHIRIIQGDGVDRHSISEVYDRITSRDEYGMWAAENLAFGSGGANLQKLDRDTMKFAFKASEITIDGESHPVYKNPITDPGKISKKGRMKVVCRKEPHGIIWDTVPTWAIGEDKLRTVFENGKILIEDTFDEIRKRCSS